MQNRYGFNNLFIEESSLQKLYVLCSSSFLKDGTCSICYHIRPFNEKGIGYFVHVFIEVDTYQKPFHTCFFTVNCALRI